MLYEKKKMLIYRIICFALLVCAIILYVSILNIPEEKYEMTDSACYIIEYYEYSDRTQCEIVTAFDRKCNGSICVEFYDKSDKLLSSESSWFFCDDDNIATTTFFIDGNVDSYYIVSYDVNTFDYEPLEGVMLFVAIIALVFFIASLLLSCREYYYNGNDIVVYAGWFHHYIKVNGIKYDEHNTIVSHVAIPLSCTLDDGTDIEVVITLTNRISMKISDRLYNGSREGA